MSSISKHEKERPSALEFVKTLTSDQEKLIRLLADQNPPTSFRIECAHKCLELLKQSWEPGEYQKYLPAMSTLLKSLKCDTWGTHVYLYIALTEAWSLLIQHHGIPENIPTKELLSYFIDPFYSVNTKFSDFKPPLRTCFFPYCLELFTNHPEHHTFDLTKYEFSDMALMPLRAILEKDKSPDIKAIKLHISQYPYFEQNFPAFVKSLQENTTLQTCEFTFFKGDHEDDRLTEKAAKKEGIQQLNIILDRNRRRKELVNWHTRLLGDLRNLIQNFENELKNAETSALEKKLTDLKEKRTTITDFYRAWLFPEAWGRDDNLIATSHTCIAQLTEELFNREIKRLMQAIDEQTEFDTSQIQIILDKSQTNPDLTDTQKKALAEKISGIKEHYDLRLQHLLETSIALTPAEISQKLSNIQSAQFFNAQRKIETLERLIHHTLNEMPDLHQPELTIDQINAYLAITNQLMENTKGEISDELLMLIYENRAQQLHALTTRVELEVDILHLHLHRTLDFLTEVAQTPDALSNPKIAEPICSALMLGCDQLLDQNTPTYQRTDRDAYNALVNLRVALKEDPALAIDKFLRAIYGGIFGANSATKKRAFATLCDVFRNVREKLAVLPEGAVRKAAKTLEAESKHREAGAKARGSSMKEREADAAGPSSASAELPPSYDELPPASTTLLTSVAASALYEPPPPYTPAAPSAPLPTVQDILEEQQQQIGQITPPVASAILVTAQDIPEQQQIGHTTPPADAPVPTAPPVTLEEVREELQSLQSAPKPTAPPADDALSLHGFPSAPTTDPQAAADALAPEASAPPVTEEDIREERERKGKYPAGELPQAPKYGSMLHHPEAAPIAAAKAPPPASSKKDQGRKENKSGDGDRVALTS